MLINKNITDFVATTASNEPVPGGGSIAALAGALSAALAEMVANLTIGKKKYVEVNDEMIEIAKALFWVESPPKCCTAPQNSLYGSCHEERGGLRTRIGGLQYEITQASSAG